MPIMETTSFRLPSGLVSALGRNAKRKGVTKSVLVRRALERYLLRDDASQSRTLGAFIDSLVVYEGSGRGDLAVKAESILRARLSGRKHRSR